MMHEAADVASLCVMLAVACVIIVIIAHIIKISHRCSIQCYLDTTLNLALFLIVVAKFSYIYFL
jgi:hypothetical protein